MSDINGLFQEIDEELQHQKMVDFWQKYGVAILTFALLIVLGTAAYTGWQTYRVKEDQKATQGLLDIVMQRKTETPKKMEELQSFVDTHPSAAHAVLARFEMADVALKSNDMKKAIEVYDALAADEKVEPVFRHLADLRSIQAQMSTAEPAPLYARLEKLFADSAFRFSAKEHATALALKMGDKDKAKQLLNELTLDKDTPPSMAQRAQNMRRWLEEGV